MTVSRADITPHFMRGTFRPGQAEVIVEAINALEGGAENVIIDAPTGVGKTLILDTVARWFTRDFDSHVQEARDILSNPGTPTADAERLAMEILSPHQAHMITSMKMLQDQYLKDDKLIQIMKGKNNYPCRVASGMIKSCHDYEQVYGNSCHKKKSPCTYRTARRIGQMARLTLHNMDSFLAQVSGAGNFTPRVFLSVDEAHGLDARLTSAMSFDLGEEMLVDKMGFLDWAPPSDVDDTGAVLPWVQDWDRKLGELAVSLRAKSAEITASAGNSFIGRELLREQMTIARRIGVIADMQQKMSRYLRTSDKPWAVEVQKNTVVFEPVRASPFAKSALTQYGKHRIFASATVFDDGRRVMAALNLDRDKTYYMLVPSIFSARSRHLVDLSTDNTGHTGYSKAKKSIQMELMAILERHAGERGVIHCSSYDMAKDITDLVPGSRLMAYTPKERDTVVSLFTSNRAPADAVLVGVFLDEGYDFKDELARFQVIVRLPYSYPTKKITMRKDMEPGYYDWLTAVRLVQICGRGTRNEQDHCVTYCLDNRLGGFLRRAGHMIPAWFMESVRQPTRKELDR